MDLVADEDRVGFDFTVGKRRPQLLTAAPATRCSRSVEQAAWGSRKAPLQTLAVASQYPPAGRSSRSGRYRERVRCRCHRRRSGCRASTRPARRRGQLEPALSGSGRRDGREDEPYGASAWAPAMWKNSLDGDVEGLDAVEGDDRDARGEAIWPSCAPARRPSNQMSPRLRTSRIRGWWVESGAVGDRLRSCDTGEALRRRPRS